VRATGLLLQEAKAAGVKHFCYVSIVGSDRVPLPYYGAKVQCEAFVRDSSLSWSIFRATQFHSLVDGVIREYAKPLLVAVLPVELRFQSIDVGEVAAELVQSALRCESGVITEMGGPEVLTLGAMASAWFAIQGKKTAVLAIHIPEQYDLNVGSGLVADKETWRLADAYRRGYNTCSGPHIKGLITWSEWLKQHLKL